MPFPIRRPLPWVLAAAITVAAVAGPPLLCRSQQQLEAQPAAGVTRDPSVTSSNPVPHSLSLKTRMEHGDGIFAVAITPDGSTIVTGDQGSHLQLWNTKTGEKVAELTGHEGSIVGLDIDPNGTRLASVGFDGIRLWRLPSGQAEHHLQTKRGEISWALFAPDGQTIASGGTSAAIPVQIWDVATGHELPSLPPASSGSRYAAFSPDGRRLATVLPRKIGFGEICIWDIPHRQELLRFSAHHGDVRTIQYTADGRGILSTDTSGEIIIWDAESGGPFAAQFPVQTSEVTAVALSRDGTILATSSRGLHTIRIWEVVTRQELARLNDHEAVVKSIAFTADGRLGVSAGFDSMAYTWNTLPTPSPDVIPSAIVTTEDGQSLWNTLCGADAAAAQHAIDRLAEHPQLAVPLVEANVRPLTPIQLDLITTSINNLDHHQGQVRQHAIQDLTALGDLAELALRRARIQRTSYTFRQRLDALLIAIHGQPASPFKVTTVRGVQLLERIGDAEARRVLAKLAQENDINPCARVASSALRRLDRLAAAAPTSNSTELPATSPTTVNAGANKQNSPAAPTNEQVPVVTDRHNNPPTAPIDPDAIAVAAEIDRLIEAQWDAAGVVPAPPADDSEWLRRVTLDLIGRIPWAYEAQDFADNPAANKRQLQIERLLNRPEYIEHQMHLWRAVLLGPPQRSDFRLRSSSLLPSLEDWLARCLRDNRRYDQMIRELLTMPLPDEREQRPGTLPVELSGTPLAYYFRQDDLAPAVLAGDCSRLFLGIQLECAQCHDHPFASWKREQFWGFAAFFSGVRTAPAAEIGLARVFGEDRGIDRLKLPGTDTLIAARFLDGSEPTRSDDVSAREHLAAWITAPDNPYFARAAANRIWGNFFGAGIVEPLDDVNGGHTSGRLDLLDMLAQRFQEHHFDLKFLAQAILSSRAYQRTSRLTHDSQRGIGLLAKMPVRSLTTEQFFDSVGRASGFGQHIVPTNKRSMFYRRGAPALVDLASRFGPAGPKTETETSMLDALALMNGSFLEKLTHARRDELLDGVISDNQSSLSERVETLYFATLSRAPRPEESARMLQYLNRRPEPQQRSTAFADLLWALLNSGEFMSNH